MEQELMEQNSQEPKTKHWAGYLSISIAFALSALVLIVNIRSAYGTNVATAAELTVAEAEESPVIVMAAEEELPQNTVENVVEAEAKTDTTEETSEEKAWHFFNLDLQDDGQILNDYDFGPNPILDNISEEKVKEAIKGKKASDTVKVEEIIEMMNADELKAEQIRRMHDDPKLGAADMAWMDSILGTRFLGTFYSAAKEQWDVAMNDAADTWIQSPEDYDKALENFERKLDHANKVEVRYQKSGLKDQMYMEPDGLNPGVPDIVVMETTNHDGYFLVYTYVVKETKTLEVAYRIDCGYQPCNVAEIMKVKAKPNPNKKTPKPKKSAPEQEEFIPIPVVVNGQTTIVWQSTTGGSSSSHHDKTKKSDHDPILPIDPIIPNPDPIPTPAKDPTKGTVVIPNDDPGPGDNTNNPSNPEISTADKPTSSDHMTPDEYDKAIKDLESANQPGGGSEGGTPSTPSTPPPTSDTKVDNNADDGNIDEPTKVHKGSQSGKKSGDHISAPD